MARIQWGVTGNKRYLTGIDRGVLYVGENATPWDGLVSIDAKPDFGDSYVSYIDGVKYLNASGPEEAAFTLSAFHSPQEFDECDGTLDNGLGFFLHNQPRKEFNLAYRTFLGNDVDGIDHGYEIHLIYNALATPSEQTYSTMSDDVDVEPLSWELTTRPVHLPGFAPTAHFKFVSHRTSANNMAYFERLIYGTDETTPHLPTSEELADLLNHLYGTAIYGTSTYA